MSTIKFSHKNFFRNLIIITLFLLPMIMLSGKASPLYASSGWEAKYWNNTTMSGTPALQRQESDLNHDWSEGSPHIDIGPENFSARWKRTIHLPSGTYHFTATMDDGMRVWVDNSLIINSWWDSQVHSLSSDVYLNGGNHEIKVEYYQVSGQAIAKVNWTAVSGGISTPPTIYNWRGEYFNNRNLSGNPAVVRDDAQINFNWGNGSPVASTLSTDNFSARWSRSLAFNAGRYRFTASSDDGLRLWVNNQLIVDKWYDHAYETYTVDVDLPSGNVPIRLDYYEGSGTAAVALGWTAVSVSSPHPQPQPPSSSAATATVAHTYNLNVRSGPGVSHPAVTVIQRGNVVELIGRNAETSWLKIRLTNGIQGWSNANFLATTFPLANLPILSEGSVSQPPANTNATGTVTSYYLNVRSGPGVGYGVTAVLSRGQVVSLSHRNASSSCVRVVLSNGQQGWVNTSYLSTSTAVTNLPVAS
jgi:uncharacterized protein YraI